nr:MAG TPA: hypothetical protein [Caudoviricetes sp.]
MWNHVLLSTILKLSERKWLCAHKTEVSFW